MPIEWYRYKLGTLVIKNMVHNKPSYLRNKLSVKYYEEPSKPGLGRFFGSYKGKICAPSLQNHIGWMKDIDEAWQGRKLTDDAIRVLLKKNLFDCYHYSKSMKTIMATFSSNSHHFASPSAILSKCPYRHYNYHLSVTLF
jgi:hypothetical protein